MLIVAHKTSDEHKGVYFTANSITSVQMFDSDVSESLRDITHRSKVLIECCSPGGTFPSALDIP